MARITALIGFPSLIASDRRFTYKAPAPSARPYPSALASKVWHAEVGERTPNLAVFICWSTVRIRLTPPTMAASQSFARSALHALCRAYIEEEQAVLIVKLKQSATSTKGVLLGLLTLGHLNSTSFRFGCLLSQYRLLWPRSYV